MECSICIQGEEGVKWELGFALFLSGKIGLALLELPKAGSEKNE